MDELVVDLDFFPYPLRVYFSDKGVSRCTFVNAIETKLSISNLTKEEYLVFDSVTNWASAYVLGEFSTEIPRINYGRITDFRKLIYTNLANTQPGERITYGKLAELSGSPRASRAVGSAMASNPFVPIIPCHRVVRGDGSLGNYSGLGGVETKQLLQDFENQASTVVNEDAST